MFKRSRLHVALSDDSVLSMMDIIVTEHGLTTLYIKDELAQVFMMDLTNDVLTRFLSWTDMESIDFFDESNT